MFFLPGQNHKTQDENGEPDDENDRDGKLHPDGNAREIDLIEVSASLLVSLPAEPFSSTEKSILAQKGGRFLSAVL
jgi:hypothetical protein